MQARDRQLLERYAMHRGGLARLHRRQILNHLILLTPHDQVKEYTLDLFGFAMLVLESWSC